VRCNAADGELKLYNARLVANGTYLNGAAIDSGTSTNIWLRDCVIQGNAAASSPVSISGSGTVRIQGTLTSNLGFSGVTLDTASGYFLSGNLNLSGYLSLSGQTNQIGDSGTSLTYNGAAIGETVWTNVGNEVSLALPTDPTNGVTFSFLFPTDTTIADWQVVVGAARSYETWTGTATTNLDYGELTLGVQIDGNGNAAPGLKMDFYDPIADIETRCYIDPSGNLSATPFQVGSGYVKSSGNLAAIQNAGTNTFTIDYTGKASAVAGFASTDTTAAVSIASTGYTNLMGKNVQVCFSGTAITAVVYNTAGNSWFTNAVSQTGMCCVQLQTGGKIILSGTGVTGSASPF
jgi:hypothetical protein